MILSRDTIPDLEDALCREVDPETFFPVGHTTDGGSRYVTRAQVDEARAICRQCPERLPCLTFALENEERHGIWAATTPEERQEMRNA